MDDVTFSAFSDELSHIKTAGLRDLWRRFTGLFRPEEEKVQLKVDYHFSPKAGNEKWNKLVKNVRNEKFVDALKKHPDADPKLVQHVESMRDLSRGRIVAKIYSSRLPGRSYEVKALGDGNLGCTCPDWRFKGSVSPGYECKHIQAHKAGRVKAD